MGWHATLSLHYTGDNGRTVALDRHDGPLRVLQRLYPEGPAVCHHVLVHPPGGLVGGDVLALQARLEPGTHALLTTPGATRFYRSTGETALQQVDAVVADGARLEWLPLEAIAYPGCLAQNRLCFELQGTAQMIGWDLTALGLPAAGAGFERGRFQQHLELPGAWLERGLIEAGDTALLDGPLGLAGHRVLGTLWFAAGGPIAPALREALLQAAREAGDADAALAVTTSGCTAPDARVVVLRVLAHRVEPAQRLFAAVWARWREIAWALPACAPRVWRT